jgi:molybdenum cofactor biosynthesis protein B
MSVKEHRSMAPNQIQCKVITVSDTRNKETDRSGALIRSLLEEQGHVVVDYMIVKDEYEEVQSALRSAAANDLIQAVILNGGTGIAHRDRTVEAVEACLEKLMPGFGELFRYLSYTEDIGSAAILSRATAGVMAHRAVFSIPGSTGAVRLAMNRLILPELRHVVREIQKDLE